MSDDSLAFQFDPSGAIFQANDAAALYDDAAYAEMLAMISRATESVRLSFFLFGGPDADLIIDRFHQLDARRIWMGRRDRC